MLVCFTPGWEEFAKWGPKEEAEIARLVLDKWDDIKKSASYARKHKDETKEVDLGVGPQGRTYAVEVTYLGLGAGQRDFMQEIGYAPTTTIGMDIMAKSLKSDWPSSRGGENILAGRVYDDGRNHVIRIVGIQENKRVLELINRFFDGYF
jgi:hypothetical protein